MAQGFVQKPITTYLISGHWSGHSGIPTHYAVHQFLDPGVSGCKRMSIVQVVGLIRDKGKFVFTWEWDYSLARFNTGEQVFFKDTPNGSYLHTNPFDSKKKHLQHLVRINWFEEVNILGDK